MSSETTAGDNARTDDKVSRTHSNDGCKWRLRCPDCGHEKTFRKRALAKEAQKRRPCPNCNRGMGVAAVETGDGGTKLHVPDEDCVVITDGGVAAANPSDNVPRDDTADCAICGDPPDGYDARLELPVCRPCSKLRAKDWYIAGDGV